jgi:hypothetical protein
MTLLLSAIVVAGLLSTVDAGQQKTPPAAQWISPDDPNLQYEGRIGFADPKAPTIHYPVSGFRTKFTGSSLALRFEEDGYGPANSFGIRIDGSPEIPLRLSPREDKTYVVAAGLDDKVHELYVYRRQDPYGGMATFKGAWIEKGSHLLAPKALPSKKIEFFGDSVSVGDAAMAFGYEEKPDSTVDYDNTDGFLNNGYFGFAAVTTRLLHAQSHINGIGGLSLLDGTGWFGGSLPNCVGLESTWDKLSPVPGQMTPWDFSRYTPDVVVISIGQNDAHGGEINDPTFRARWFAAYARVLDGLRSHYPNAHFVLTTTILMHSLDWDKAIQEVAAQYCASHGEDRARYFAFKRTGVGTPGHPRIREEMEMGQELAHYLEHLPGVWSH